MVSVGDVKWTEAFYGSGSMTITSNLPDMPHYRFGYPGTGLNENERDRLRHDAVMEVVVMLNGGPKVFRAGDAVRDGKNWISLWNGIDIHAAGPFYDASRDGSLHWKQRPGHKWDMRRKELIDHLWNILTAPRQGKE